MISNFSALTLIVLTGYLFQISILPLRIKLSLQNRYHVLFGSAAWGLVIYLVVGTILDEFAIYLESHLNLSQLFKPFVSKTFSIDINVVYSFIGVAAAYALVRLMSKLAIRYEWAGYLRFKERIVSGAFQKYGSNMLKLVNRAYEESLYVQVTLSNRKIYIGLVADTVDPEAA